MSLLGPCLALVVGLSLGLLGGGGSILTLPILIYAVGMAPKPAIASSLLVVAVASAIAMLGHAFAKRVAWKLALWFGGASMTSAYLAGRLAHFIEGPWLLSSFIVVMLVTGAAMLRPSHPGDRREPSMRKATLAGASVGALTGLVGAGGGFLIVPALTMFAGLEMAYAVGTSLLIITLNSLAGFAGYLGHVALDWPMLFAIMGAASLGSLAGSALSRFIPATLLRRGFAVFVIAVGMWMLGHQLPPSTLHHALRDARVTHTLAALLGAALTYLALRLRSRRAVHEAA